MEIIKELKGFELDGRGVVTIGKFDGLHLGHQALIRRAVEETLSLRERGVKARTVVFAFDVSPVMLLTKKERRAMLEDLGVDTLIECSFGPRIITLSAEDFVRDILVRQLHTAYVVVGRDFRFGYERRGDADLLKDLGAKFDFGLAALPDVMDGNRKVSSSVIKAELAAGHMDRVNRLLGYPFSVTGKIIHGQQVGRTIGVPTANIKPSKHKLLPPNGVYAAEAEVNGRICRGVTDIGTKPTVDGQFVGVETYLFDFSGDIYGEKLTVRLLEFTRPEKKFDSLEELKKQIARDSVDARTYFAEGAKNG